jgi:hypothetical protein
VNRRLQFLTRPGTYRWAICDRCHGHGTVDHPAFSNGISMDEWSGPDWDDESRENYLRGAYDVKCTAGCEGGKVREPIVANLTFAEKRALVGARRAERVAHEIERDSRCERWAEERYEL